MLIGLRYRRLGFVDDNGAPETTTTSADRRFVEATDLVYMTINGAELLMDVYTPAVEGPWPVVVAFHGIDSDGKDGQDTVTVAEAAAAEGIFVSRVFEARLSGLIRVELSGWRPSRSRANSIHRSSDVTGS